MRSAFYLALIGSLACLGINALVLEKRTAPAVLSLPFERRQPTDHRRHHRRSGELSVPIVDRSGLFYVPLQLGTPPQTTYVQLDTGSAYLIVETPSSNLCQKDPSVCTSNGAYTANSSSSYRYIDSDLSIFYGSNDGTTGDDAYDVLQIGNAVIQTYRFGIQYNTTVGEGILGVSPVNPNNSPAFEGIPAEGHFPSALVANGIIASKAFSLWLNDERAASGQVLFGGVDTKKYRGNLVTINLVPETAGQPAYNYIIPLLLVTLTDAGGTTKMLAGGKAPGNTILDSGTNQVYLPTQLAKSIFTALGSDISNPFVDCSLAYTSTTLNFGFQGITIHAPISQFLGTPQGTQCQLLINADDDAVFILGDPALTSMYIVYDIDNSQVSLAETVFNATASNVLQIMAGPNGVPKQPGVGGTTSSTSRTSSSSKSSSTSKSTSTSLTSSSSKSSSTSKSTSTSMTSSSSKSSSTSKSTSTSMSSSTSKTTSSSKTTSTTMTTPTSKTVSTTKTTSTVKTTSTPYITDTIGYPISKATTFTLKPTNSYTVGVVLVVTPSPYPPEGSTRTKPYYITDTIGYPISKATTFTNKPTSPYSVGVIIVVTPSPYPK